MRWGVFRLQCVHKEIGEEPPMVAGGTPAAHERLRALDHVLDPGQGVKAEAVTGDGAYGNALAALAERHTRTARYSR
ncbi:hypothetical protein JKP88DRAFT_286830 [Tribonema minus]|uniref:Transposase n=1 Tax=Tribonema minus TaxID=303371 RepID=A0A835ZA37_9STRA|nr:hypothetical protein JKP88DRAFT_286830 [Tribonema minus]